MNYAAKKEIFPVDEHDKLNELENLFKMWREHIKDKLYKNYEPDDLVFDGFYPYFSKQTVKMLYIGRESLGISGFNYIDILYDAYKSNKVANKSINVVSNSFHNLMFYLTYGVNKNFPEWKDIPYASELTNKFATNDGISFATMNLSKYSNEDQRWKSNWELINSFLNVSSNGTTNFYNKEIEIINPDIIITMNLSSFFVHLGKTEMVEKNDHVDIYKIEVASKQKYILDTHHFSAPKYHGSPEYFYIPIMNAINKHNLLEK